MDTENTPMAFPCVDNGNLFSEGMELRDYFAGEALASVFATQFQADDPADAIAEACYLMADAMMKERAKKVEKPVDKI